MYTVILSFLLGILLGTGLRLTHVSSLGWSIFFGLLATGVAYGLATWHFKKKLTAKMMDFQYLMQEGQKKLQNRVNLFQVRPTGSPAQMLAEIEKMQHDIVQQALGRTSELEPFIHWVPLMKRQIATMRMQFHYQLKEFDKVEELLPSCLFIDPLSMSMKLAQYYRSGKTMEEMEKLFRHCALRLKYNQGVLLYSLMAWIYLQKENTDAAYKTLLDACKNNEHDTLNRNRDRLANNKVKEFSNAGLGDQWYALLLEQPKVQYRRQQMRPDGRPF